MLFTSWRQPKAPWCCWIVAIVQRRLVKAKSRCWDKFLRFFNTASFMISSANFRSCWFRPTDNFSYNSFYRRTKNTYQDGFSTSFCTAGRKNWLGRWSRILRVLRELQTRFGYKEVDASLTGVDLRPSTASRAQTPNRGKTQCWCSGQTWIRFNWL